MIFQEILPPFLYLLFKELVNISCLRYVSRRTTGDGEQFGDSLMRCTYIHTHTTAYYRNKVGTMYHAAELEDLPWYMM